MTDRETLSYLHWAFKYGCLSPEDLDGMTWNEIKAWVKKLGEKGDYLANQN